MGLDIVALKNARTTFQRIGDAKFFNGWVRHINANELMVHTSTTAAVKVGQEFSFQVYGNRKDAYFHGRLLASQGADPAPLFSSDRNGHAAVPIDMLLEMTSDLTLKDSQGNPRFWVEGVSADLDLDGEDPVRGAIVIDIGPGGFAALVERKYARGEEVPVCLFASGQIVTCKCEVRSCVANTLSTDYYRLGLQIQAMERVDALRWKQLYATILESNKMLSARTTAEVGTVVKLKMRNAA